MASSSNTEALTAELAERWKQLSVALELSPSFAHEWVKEGQRLLRSWNRWPRRYHDLHHLAACLRHAESVRASLGNPQAVELALWYHDAIYWPWSAKNEQRSADWARAFLGAAVSETLIDTVVQYVLDTRHMSPAPPGDSQWVIDIDLAILGQPDAVYRQFERNVRAEYRFIPWRKYTARRLRVLGSFAARERIYETPEFSARFEAQARANLAHAMEALARGELYGPIKAHA